MIIPIRPWLESEGALMPSLGRGFAPASGIVLSADAEMDEYYELGRPDAWFPKIVSANEPATRMEFYHDPILGNAVAEAMRPLEGRQIFDGTLGGGGHSELFLKGGAHVIGCDRDAAALAHAGERLARFGDRFLPVRGNFAEIRSILDGLGVDFVDGILLDVGVSSRQLDDPDRGFSFRSEGPLDMRMDLRQALSARVIVNEWEEAELCRIFREYGEEQRAARAARFIAEARRVRPLETTLELAEVVARAIPKTGPKHPATKVFQAIRIAVNDELGSLARGLEGAVESLAPGGVLAVISFHSLEDRFVKQFFRERSAPFLDRPEWPAPRPNPAYTFDLPGRRAIVPDKEEQGRNPRSRSAKLRLAVKI